MLETGVVVETFDMAVVVGPTVAEAVVVEVDVAVVVELSVADGVVVEVDVADVVELSVADEVVVEVVVVELSVVDGVVVEVDVAEVVELSVVDEVVVEVVVVDVAVIGPFSAHPAMLVLKLREYPAQEENRFDANERTLSQVEEAKELTQVSQSLVGTFALISNKSKPADT